MNVQQSPKKVIFSLEDSANHMKVLSRVNTSLWELLHMSCLASGSLCFISYDFAHVDKSHGAYEPCCSQPLVTFGVWKHLGTQSSPAI